MEKDKWSGPHPKTIQKITDGRTWCPSLLETQMALRNQSRTTRDGCVLLKTLRKLETVCEIRREPCLGVANGVANAGTNRRYIRCFKGPSAPGMLVECFLLLVVVATTGSDWRRIVVVAPNDDD